MAQHNPTPPPDREVKTDIGRIVGNTGNCCLGFILAPFILVAVLVAIALLAGALRDAVHH